MRTKIDVCVFIESLQQGGAERVASILCNEWAHQGMNVALCTPLPAELDAYTLHPSVLRMAGDQSPICGGAWRKLLIHLQRVVWYWRVMRRLTPSTCVAFMVEAIIFQHLGSRLLWQHRPSLIGSERSDPKAFSNGLVWGALRRWAYLNLHRMIAQTGAAASEILRICPAVSVQVIPNPVPFPIAAQHPLVSVEGIVSPGRRVVLSVGRLIQSKQFDVLLEIFGKVRARLKEAGAWQLIIVGEGPERLRLENLAREYGIEGHVVFAGRVGNVGDFLQRADIFAMTSAKEGFPNALAEALAHGVPSVAFDCNHGPRDLIDHGRNGLLVKLNDADRFVDVLQDLMGSAQLRETLSSHAITFRDQYSIEIITSQWSDILATGQQGDSCTH